IRGAVGEHPTAIGPERPATRLALDPNGSVGAADLRRSAMPANKRARRALLCDLRAAAAANATGRLRGGEFGMNPHATRAAEVEAAFLAGAEINLNTARGARLRGTRWKWRTQDAGEYLRNLLAARHQYDRDILRSVPKNTSRILTGTVPRWLW